MDIAKELILNLKQTNKSHVGYGLQKECEALVGHILQNMIQSELPELIPEVKNEQDSIEYREQGINTSYLLQFNMYISLHYYIIIGIFT